MFENREASGRIGKWATQLAEHTIDFVSRSAIKSQVLADFIADWTPVVPSQEQPKIEAIWQLECDGAYQRDGAGASAVLTAPSGTQLKYAVRLDFTGCTNNVASSQSKGIGRTKTDYQVRFRVNHRSNKQIQQDSQARAGKILGSSAKHGETLPGVQHP